MLEDINRSLFCLELVYIIRVGLRPKFLRLFELLVRDVIWRLYIAIYLPPLNGRLGLNPGL